MTSCSVKALLVKVIGSKPHGYKKSNHVKGWCGPGCVISLMVFFP